MLQESVPVLASAAAVEADYKVLHQQRRSSPVQELEHILYAGHHEAVQALGVSNLSDSYRLLGQWLSTAEHFSHFQYPTKYVYIF